MTDKQKQIKFNLAEISEMLKFRKDMWDEKLVFCWTVNEMLAVNYKIEWLNLKTFVGRKKDWKRVKKNEKGYLFWTKPIKAIKKEETENWEEKENKYKFYNFCYLYTEEQVG